MRASFSLACALENRFEKYLGFSAQRNFMFGRTQSIASHPMTRKAPARACRSSPFGCGLFLSSLAVLFLCAVCASSLAIAQVHSSYEWRRKSGLPRRRRVEAAHARARARPPARPPARPTDRPTDRTTTTDRPGRIARRLSYSSGMPIRSAPTHPRYASLRFPLYDRS